jgi:hypothetical protein
MKSPCHRYLSLLFTALCLSMGSAQAQPATAAATDARAAPAPAIASSTSSAPAEALAGAPLLALLRAGGHVIYFRHTATDFSKNDSGMRSYDDCANQRLLSAQGRSDAQRIGEMVRALGLPMGQVLASPYCRTMEHATLAFGPPVPRNEIREAQGGDYPGLKLLLAGPVAAGSNRWIVGHGTPFRTIAGPPHLSEGEAAVIRPEGNGWTVVARLPVQGWAALQALP